MKKLLKLGWVIFLDVVAIALLLFALAFGWLPGAPGIPIALAGLSLLAINHTWAKDLLDKLKLKFVELKDKLKKQGRKND